MVNTYSWTIDSLYSTPSLNEQTDVITIANWIVTGSDGANTSVVKGSQPLTYTAGSPFIPYASLSEDTVLEWVRETMGKDKVAEIETQIDAQIANIIASAKNNLLVKNPLPWVKN